jgi:membrane protein DedA with SNARE-associated domain
MKECILRLVELFQAHPYSLVFGGLLSCGLGVPLPEEFFLVMSGYVCFLNGVSSCEGLFPMFLVTWLAIGGGDLIVFFLGRRWGNSVFETRIMQRLVSPHGRAKAEEFLAGYGRKTIFAARFLPGIRMPTFLTCGLLGVPLSTFAMYDGSAMLISVPIQVYLSWRYGAVLDDAIKRVARMNQLFLAIGIVVVVLVTIRLHTGSRRNPGSLSHGPSVAENNK